MNQRLSQQVITNMSYLNNSEAVIRNSSMLHKEIIQMQSGFRGFLLAQQESFLQPYYEGINSVQPLIKEQRTLLSSVDQQEKLDSILILHKEWIEYADSLISAKKDTMPESNARYQRLFDKKLKMEVGKKLNDRINVLFVELDNYEYGVRKERRAILQKSVKDTRNISIVLIIGAIIIAIISSFYFIKAISSRISKMVNLAERISKGEFISITDTKKDEFSKLIHSLNQMSETLEKNFNELTKKNKELDQFAYVVSHDLKAPLRGISNIISWIEEDHVEQVTPEINRNLILIKGRTTRLENMINGLLEYARVGKTKKSIEAVPIQDVLNELIDLIVPPGTSLVISKELPVIHAVKVHIEQVFANLLSNAVKYNSNKNPEIKVVYRETEKYHEFSVSDNGPGIENKYFEKIFEIFQTLQERDAFESTGMGLAIVKKIIEDNKGTIAVESIRGKGTTFIFTWPKNKESKK
jgi:signal transduction histidine kinase